MQSQSISELVILGYQQIYSKLHLKKLKSQNNQQNVERKEQSKRTDSTLLEDLLLSYSGNQDSIALVKG